MLGINAARGARHGNKSVLGRISIHERTGFNPETIEAMSIAYENVCNSLNLVDRSGLLNEFIARNIIELATCGLHDAARLSAGVLAIYKPAAE